MFLGAINARHPRNVLRPVNVHSADSPPDRREMAFAAIEGRKCGMLELNPWVPILDFDAAFANAVNSSGGLVFTFALNDPVSFTDTDRIALLWDDQVLADGPKTVIQGTRVVMTVAAAKGTRLSLWATSMLAPTVVDQKPLSQLSAVVSRENDLAAAQKKADDAKPGPLAGVAKFFQDTLKIEADAAKTVALGVVVVGGVVLYFYLKKNPLGGG